MLFTRLMQVRPADGPAYLTPLLTSGTLQLRTLLILFGYRLNRKALTAPSDKAASKRACTHNTPLLQLQRHPGA